MNTITIELCAEDRARLDAILEALREPRNCSGCVETVVGSFDRLVQTRDAATAPTEPPQKPTEEPTQPVTPPTEEKPEESAIDPPEREPEPTVDRADIQRKVVELSSAGKKAEVKAIVTAYADRVSTIPEDKLAEVFEKLSALEG